MGWFQSSSSLVRYKILIHEDEHKDKYEKNQIRSHASALRLFFFALKLAAANVSPPNQLNQPNQPFNLINQISLNL